MSAALLVLLALAAGPTAEAPSSPAPVPPTAAGSGPAEVRCRAVLGPQLRTGAWGVVRLERRGVAASAGPDGRPAGLVQEIRGARHCFPGTLIADRGGERVYLVTIRPMSGAKLLDGSGGADAASLADEVVAAPESHVVAELGRLSLPATAPAAFRISPVAVAELPEDPALCEGLDLLVIGDLDGALPSARSRAALRGWLRSGGRVFVASPGSRAELADVLFAGGRPPAEKPGQPVTFFRTGFGRGAFLSPAVAGTLSSEEARAAWDAYHRLLESPRPPLCAPALSRGLVEDSPPLDGELLGAAPALRWALAGALLVVAAGLALWRRGRPWRLAAGAAVAAAVAAAALAAAVRPPEGRAFSVRIDEFSADGAGTRARELLHVEKAAPGDWRIEIRGAPGALPAPILSDWEAGGDFSSDLASAAPGSGEGLSLHVTMPAGGADELLFGCGPLPVVGGMTAPPPGAREVRYLAGLNRAGATAAIADCLAPSGGRGRRQAEHLAERICSDLEARGLIGGASSVTVCRLRDEAPALSVSGRVRSFRLGRLGVFVAAGAEDSSWK